jgi:hypothetical protein
MKSTRQAALWYASQGWPVIPIWPVDKNQKCTCGQGDCDKNRGKHTVSYLCPNGHKNATVNKKVINRWWDRKPNWNIATPKFLRVDVDTKADGLANWGDLMASMGGLHDYVMVHSPSGGQHWYFLPGTNSGHTNQTGKLPAGIDVRGDGSGYTLLPPSNHVMGLYQWGRRHPKEYEIPAAPDWLLDLIGPDEKNTILAEFTEDVQQPDINELKTSGLIKALLQGDRSTIDFCVVNALINAGLSNDEIKAIFQQSPPTNKLSEKGDDGLRYLALTISNARNNNAKYRRKRSSL